MANSVDPIQTAPIGSVCSGSRLFASIFNLSVMLSNYLQLTTSADNISRSIFFLGALRVKKLYKIFRQLLDYFKIDINGKMTFSKYCKTLNCRILKVQN